MSYIGNQPTNTSFLVDTFSGNGSTTSFTMSVAPATPNSVFVIISGVVQAPNTYATVGNNLNFTQAPPAGSNNIVVRYLALPASNVTTSAYRSYTELTATTGQTTFTPASYTPGFIDVYRNGIKLNNSSFSATNGSTVVLSNPANAGDSIVVIGFFISTVLNAIPNVAGSIGANLYDASGQGGTGAMMIPTGTTAQRPTSPTNGMLRKNTTTGYVEYWDPTSSQWVAIGAFAATGGALTNYTIGSTNYQVHTFLTSSVFVVNAGVKSVDYLIVGGGGGGGGRPYHGGGGGAGGFLSGTYTVSPGTYTITVGAGGTGYAGPNDNSNNGNSSSAFGLTAVYGGGGGGSASGSDGVGQAGGSGGGSSVRIGSVASGTAGQGNAGGAGQLAPETPNYGAGGGGGSGSVGGNGTTTTGGVGGSGTNNSIRTGSAQAYAGGGGGSTYGGGTPGSGSAGGGAGIYGPGGGDGTANTGSGGGGRDSRGPSTIGSGNGGSGIVVIRYTV